MLRWRARRLRLRFRLLCLHLVECDLDGKVFDVDLNPLERLAEERLGYRPLHV